ncbi:MAG TPA: pyruvate formate lyase-activating protein [Candidatus Ornithomonoglobus intestinigallinarum]|uniref:Pyruvate formate-lyase-activating enzyme n=1 Tax=Candidatus Ornithomonoglobus intestinigallinarum TaxID=2840894 RepID=A0A9D1H123_9FIRM|nr:pyruvate formate lyase-activating protein [Candidatus Ornithomonoglobus intestinigallinarum]
MEGYIHSIESCGTVDGPGIRFVIFMQGCPMRCLYCHNPDTWETGAGEKTTAGALLSQYEKCRNFTKGGITVTGGEPLLQIDFVTELFKAAKKQNIHTCIDTSGITYTEGSKKFDELIKYTDLVMLDIKHIDPARHKALTGRDNKNILKFAKYLDDNNIPIWIRHVVVPNVTDDEKYLFKLGEFIGSLKNVKALDVLPYHTMGKAKYDELGIKYPLEGVEPMSKEGALKARAVILDGMRSARNIK